MINTIPFTLAPPQNEMLKYTLNKIHIRSIKRKLQTEKKIKEKLSKWRYIPHSGIKRLNIIKMSILPHMIYRLSAIPIKILTGISIEIYKLILQFIWKCKGPRMILKKRNTVEENANWFQQLYSSTVWHWRKVRHMDKWNGIECPDIDQYIYSELVFNKGAGITQWGKHSLFNKWYLNNCILICGGKWTSTQATWILDHKTYKPWKKMLIN